MLAAELGMGDWRPGAKKKKEEIHHDGRRYKIAKDSPKKTVGNFFLTCVVVIIKRF